MAVAQNDTFYDGIWYKAGETLPDLGSWVNVAESGSERYQQNRIYHIKLNQTYIKN